MAAQSVNLTVKEWLSCCGSNQFAAEVAKVGPFDSLGQAIEASRTIWWSKVDILGWLEAFGAHPRIGDVDALRKRFSSGSCEGEQAEALGTATDQHLKDLAEWNRQYERKFGIVFLICATGKSSAEILSILKGRFTNRPIVELQVAASEQQKITELRLRKILERSWASHERHVSDVNLDHVILSSTPDAPPPPWATPLQVADMPHGPRHVFQRGMKKHSKSMWTDHSVVDRRLSQIGAQFSAQPGPDFKEHVSANPEEQPAPLLRTRPPITTHVLDVSLGRPGSGIEVKLDWLKEGSSNVSTLNSKDWQWSTLGTSVTDDDGRSGPLMPLSNTIPAGRYRLTFDTEPYFLRVHSSVKAAPGSKSAHHMMEEKPKNILEVVWGHSGRTSPSTAYAQLLLRRPTQKKKQE